jgi:hypothetical protein
MIKTILLSTLYSCITYTIILFIWGYRSYIRNKNLCDHAFLYHQLKQYFDNDADHDNHTEMNCLLCGKNIESFSSEEYIKVTEQYASFQETGNI